MKYILACICFLGFMEGNSQSSYRKDFDFLWTTINDDYAYWDKKATGWNAVKDHYAPRFDTVTGRERFVLLLEKVFNEIYDHHASLNTNYNRSQRLVPSGTDIWAEYINGKPVITEVRPGFGAALVGMKPGMEIVSVNDIDVSNAILPFMPVSLRREDNAAKSYALRVLLAGAFKDDRKITVKDKSGTKTFYPDRPVHLLLTHKYASDIESRVLPGNIGYIRINNRLGDNDLIPRFDSVVTSLQHTKALILDLRETPSGGNTTVARAILGRFITKEMFYQKHELPAEERAYGVKRSWEEIVSPRKDPYTKPMAVLVNHWTGSVSEGIAIGFDALKRATVIGTPMAKLAGANYSYQMPESKIGFSFPVEKLYHINGTPREDFVPAIIVDVKNVKENQDPILAEALNFLQRKR